MAQLDNATPFISSAPLDSIMHNAIESDIIAESFIGLGNINSDGFLRPLGKKRDTTIFPELPDNPFLLNRVNHIQLENSDVTPQIAQLTIKRVEAVGALGTDASTGESQQLSAGQVEKPIMEEPSTEEVTAAVSAYQTEETARPEETAHRIEDTEGNNETLGSKISESIVDNSTEGANMQVVSIKDTLEVTMTAYSSTVDQTDNSPFTTSTLEPVRVGIVAVSRDLLGEQLPYGTTLRVLEASGEEKKCGAWSIPILFEVQDTMHLRKRNQIDLWMTTRDEALDWGYCQASVEIISVQATTRPANVWDALRGNTLVSLAVSFGVLGQTLNAPKLSQYAPHMLNIFGMVLPSINIAVSSAD